MLHLHFKFADTRLCDLSPHDIQKRLDRLNDTPSEHHHAFAVLRAFLNWAHQKHYVGEHPMARMKSPSVGKPRARILTDEELKAVWKACGDDTHSTIVRLLILTGQRKGEIAALTQAMIGADNITLPAWLTKNSREHIFPLPALTASVVASSVARVRSLKKSEPIFGVTVGDSRKRFSAWSKCKARLDVDAAVTGWTLHDLRRTFASGLAGQGVGLPVIEKILNHVSGSFAGIVGVYQRYDFQPEMRAALEKWERHLQTISA